MSIRTTYAKRSFEPSGEMRINDNLRGYFVWVGRVTRHWQPKTKGFQAGDRLFSWGKYG